MSQILGVYLHLNNVMAKKVSNIERAYAILQTYNGENNQIRYLKSKFDKNQLILSEDGFDTEYIIKNHDYTPIVVNKVVKISSILGKTLQEKYEIDFLPEKLLIKTIIGEMGGSYHCLCQYRQSVPAKFMYLQKRHILTELFPVDYESLEIDFDKYDKISEKYGRKLKEHQKTAVKFLVGNRKCILADSMGLGKSLSAIVAALETGSKKILVITTASLKTTWKREIGFYEPDENICVISGSKWNGETAKFTVINYDIVQKYYEIPLEQEYEEQYLDNGNGEMEKVHVPVFKTDKKTGKLVPKMVKSRKKSKVQESLKNSPLFLSNFDCVIIDEAQKLSNNTSNRYKVIYDFLMKSKIPYVFLTTGTPLTNTPMNLYHILRLINAPVTSDYEFFVKRYCDGKTMYRPGEFNKWKAIAERNGLEGNEKFDYISANAKQMTIPRGACNLDELREKIKHLYIRRLSSDIPGMVNKLLDTRYYDLNETQKAEYDRLWDEYVNAQLENGDNSNEEYRQLVEGMLVRQFLANEMVENTKQLVDDYIEDGEKVIIVCNFTSELEKFKKYYGKKCVTYDGKMTPKQKDKAVEAFMNDKKVKVFIGQEVAMSVGLTLTSSHIMVFNSYSWSENDNRQTQDRIYRITQTEDALCIYQLFTDSISQDMFDKVMRKGLIMDETIKSENDK